MDRNHHHKKSNWKNQNNAQKTNNSETKKTFQFDSTNYENSETQKKRLEAIQELKGRECICPICNQNISDLPSAMIDKTTGNPAHFECVIRRIEENEEVGENEKVAYIGQGRFGVLYFENPRDQRKFTIKKIIEYEDKDKPAQWRSEISEIYSKIN